MPVRRRRAARARLHVAARGAGEQHDELRHRAREPLDRVEQHVRPLDQLRLEPVAPADAVLLERADDEARRPGSPSSRRASARSAASRAPEARRGRSPIGIRNTFSGAIAGAEHELLHRPDRDLDAVELRRAGDARSRSTCRTRACPACPGGRGGTRRRAGCRAARSGWPSSANWLAWKIGLVADAAIHASAPTRAPERSRRRARSGARRRRSPTRCPSPATNSRECGGHACVRQPIARRRSGAPTRRMCVVAGTIE